MLLYCSLSFFLEWSLLPESEMEQVGMILGSSAVTGIVVEAVVVVSVISGAETSMPSSVIEAPKI